MIEIGNFLWANVSNSSPATMVLRDRCAEVVRKMKNKLKKENFIGDDVSVAVDVNYNQSIACQIELGLIVVINKSQEPMLHLMETFNITEHSQYCYPITSILDIRKCYIDLNRNISTIFQPITDRSYVNLVNEQKAIQRLADIVSDFNSMYISPEDEEDENVNEDLLQGEIIHPTLKYHEPFFQVFQAGECLLCWFSYVWFLALKKNEIL